MRGGEVLSDPETLPEGEPGSTVTPPTPAPPVPPGPGIVPAVGPNDRYTSLSPDEVHNRLGQMLQMQGWSVTSSAPGRFDVSMSIPGSANTLLGVVLILICLVPGIIYFIVKGRPTLLKASITFVPSDTGTRLAVHGSPEALERLGPVMVMLPW